jgi:hypothetical protein
MSPGTGIGGKVTMKEEPEAAAPFAPDHGRPEDEVEPAQLIEARVRAQMEAGREAASRYRNALRELAQWSPSD